MKTKINFGDILLWLGVVLILIWVLLKSFGVIHSPVWIEMVPYFGIGISIAGGAYKLGKIMNSIEDTGKKVNKLVILEEDSASLK
jgi:hypothetical protein